MPSTEPDKPAANLGYVDEERGARLPETAGGTLPLFRLYHPKSGNHFYTISLDEREHARKQDGYRYEGRACQVLPLGDPPGVPLFRLYHPKSGNHFYTISPDDRKYAHDHDGYRFEGVACYVPSAPGPQTTPLFRLYHPKSGNHFYTISPDECEHARDHDGYRYEGVACQVFPPIKPLISLPYLQEVVTYWAPVVYLHPDEEYKCSSVDFYLQHVRLNFPDRKPVGPPVTAADIPNDSDKTYLSIPDEEDWIKGGDLRSARCYAHVLGISQNGELRGFDIQYFFFYPFNGDGQLRLKPPGIPPVDIHLPLGHHQGDWEAIVVRVDLWGDIRGLYCNQHGTGNWYLPGGFDVRQGQPILYSARNGHPTYPAVGDFPNEDFGFNWTYAGFECGVTLNNATGRGAELNCRSAHELVAMTGVPGISVQEPWWLNYLGRYGFVESTDEDRRRLIGDLDAVLWFIPLEAARKELATEIADTLIKYYGKVLPDGPEPPKTKDYWSQPEKDGPSV